MTHAQELAKAQRALAKRDARINSLIKQAGPCQLTRGRRSNDFRSLARTVTYQQLAGRAAETIWQRVQDAVGDEVTPENIARTNEVKLRKAGLSNSKMLTIKGLAQACLDGTVDLQSLRKLDDDHVVEHLTRVKGIGPWTSHMFLMFQLGRLDVWPTGDYGVRVGYSKLFGLPETIQPKVLADLGEEFRPYRSVLAWYCWRVVDG